MGRLAVVLGSSATGERFAPLQALVEEHGGVAFQRHGRERYTLPHEIDHGANLRWLQEAGCDRVLGVGSVGSLREEVGVGTIVCPDDFIALQLRVTTLDGASAHTTPGFDPGWRAALLGAAAAGGAGLEDGGVYWQTTGPRFETPAEIRLLAAHAQLVGMTLASECVVAGELGLPYASICVVDNLANGIGPGPLGVEELEPSRDANAIRLRECLGSLLPGLG